MMQASELFFILVLRLLGVFTEAFAFAGDRTTICSTCLSKSQARYGKTKDLTRFDKTSLYFEGKGNYYGESDSSFMIQEFSTFDGLEEIVRLAAKPLPERPDGIVAVAKFTSAIRKDCRDTEAGYERLARENADTVFLRCFEEYQNADMLMGQAEVTSLPTFDIFYGGSRVGRVEGPDYDLVEKFIKNYGMVNSKLDLFSEAADNKRRLQWGDGKVKDWRKTPRTTARFIPGYDWDKDRGFFDDIADKQAKNFESQFENWTPPQDER